MSVRFKRSDPMQVDATATVAPGHTITKERCPAQRSGESGFAIFRCTCGWEGRTATGVSNTVAEMHAREVAAEQAAEAQRHEFQPGDGENEYSDVCVVCGLHESEHETDQRRTRC